MARREMEAFTAEREAREAREDAWIEHREAGERAMMHLDDNERPPEAPGRWAPPEPEPERHREPTTGPSPAE